MPLWANVPTPSRYSYAGPTSSSIHRDRAGGCRTRASGVFWFPDHAISLGFILASFGERGGGFCDRREGATGYRQKKSAGL